MLREIILCLRLKPVKKNIFFLKTKCQRLVTKKKVCFYTELLSARLKRTFCQVKVNKLKLKLKELEAKGISRATNLFQNLY